MLEESESFRRWGKQKRWRGRMEQSRKRRHWFFFAQWICERAPTRQEKGNIKRGNTLTLQRLHRGDRCETSHCSTGSAPLPLSAHFHPPSPYPPPTIPCLRDLWPYGRDRHVESTQVVLLCSIWVVLGDRSSSKMLWDTLGCFWYALGIPWDPLGCSWDPMRRSEMLWDGLI